MNARIVVCIARPPWLIRFLPRTLRGRFPAHMCRPTHGDRHDFRPICSPRERVPCSAPEVTPMPQSRLIGTIGLVTWLLVRSEEHTSELQSRVDLVCRLLLEKKKKRENKNYI